MGELLKNIPHPRWIWDPAKVDNHYAIPSLPLCLIIRLLFATSIPKLNFLRSPKFPSFPNSVSTAQTSSYLTFMECVTLSTYFPLWASMALFSPSSLPIYISLSLSFLASFICWCSQVSALTHLIPLYTFFSGYIIHFHFFLLVSSLFLLYQCAQYSSCPYRIGRATKTGMHHWHISPLFSVYLHLTG